MIRMPSTSRGKLQEKDAMRDEDQIRGGRGRGEGGEVSANQKTDLYDSRSPGGAPPDPLSPPNQSSSPFAVAVVENTAPGGAINKNHSLDPNGQLQTRSNPYVTQGRVEVREFDSIGQFMEFRAKLPPNLALCMGRPIYDSARIVRQEDLKNITPEDARSHRIIARDSSHFSWSDGPTLVMLDIDRPEKALAKSGNLLPTSPAGWRDLLISLIPGLQGCPMAWVPSSSSFLYNGPDELTGLSGQRIYFVIDAGLNVPVFKEVIREQLILRELSWYEISKSGAHLERFPFDLLVYQPERLDFAAAPTCLPPIEWRPEPYIVWNNDGDPLDSSTLRRASPADRRKIDAIRKRLWALKSPEAKATRERYSRHLAHQMSMKDPGVTAEDALRIVGHALDEDRLLPSFILHDSEGQTFTVGELLKDPRSHHGRRFCDPLEPDYRGDSRIAVFLVDDRGRCRIYSHAHGGRQWQCADQVPVVRLGRLQDTVRSISDALEEDDCGLFLRGDTIVEVDPDTGVLRDLEGDALALRLQRRFEVLAQRGDRWGPSNIPLRDLKALVSSARSLPLPELDSVVRGPCVTIEGDILDIPGYDPPSRLLYITPPADVLRARRQLTIAEAEESVRLLLSPFSEYQLVDPVDWGVLLAAILNCVSRQSIPTGPAFLSSAPIQGSGKTLIGESLGALTAMGRVGASVLPNNEEEIRKQLFSMQRRGQPFLFFDNLERGAKVDSPALASFITSPVWEQRVLQQSRVETIVNRSTVFFSGNNVQLIGDLRRRVLPIRIDPGVERPWMRTFSFHPVSRTLANLLPLRLAAAELIHAANSEGQPNLPFSTGFPDWDRLVRGTVLWVIDRLDAGYEFGDPGLPIREADTEDEEAEGLGDLLEAWFSVFGCEEVSLKTLFDRYIDEPFTAVTNDPPADSDMAGDMLRDAIRRVTPLTRRGSDQRTAFGRYLQKYHGRPARGLKIEKGGLVSKARAWKVVETDGRLRG